MSGGGPTEPRLAPLGRLSPSLGEALRACGLRVAFRSDPEYGSLRRPSPASALGLVSHALLEALARGDYDTVMEGELEPTLQAAWNAHVYEMQAEIEKAWPLGSVPPPSRWPGYQLTRVRLLRLLIDQARRRRGGNRAESALVAAEKWLEAPGLPLHGRADRIERSASGVELVDLKSGWTLPAELQPSHRRQLLFYAYLWHAESGEWPARASVQRLDGTRLSFEIDPTEASDLVSDLLRRLEAFNRAAEDGSPPESLAAPAAATCRHCEYRASCRSFFRAVDDGWGWYLKSVVGSVTARFVDGASAVFELDVEASNLPDGVSRVRLLGVPSDLLPEVGQRVAVVDATPTRVPGNLRATWETQLWTWH